MAARKTSRPASGARRRPQKLAARRFSALAGGALILVALFWFAWLLFRQLNPAMPSITFPLPSSTGQQPATSSSTASNDPLAAAGITLTAPAQNQKPALTRQQAIFLAGQIEPGAVATAGGVDALYTLFSYNDGRTPQASFHAVPVWLVHYSKITEPHPDTADDPHASSTSHDFYVFLAANSGQALLTIWL